MINKSEGQLRSTDLFAQTPEVRPVVAGQAGPLPHPARLRYRASLVAVLCVMTCGAMLAGVAVKQQALGITLIFCSACLLPAIAALWWHSRWLDRRLKMLQEDNLACWSFSDEEWRLVRLLDAEWSQETSGTARQLGAISGVMLALILCLGWLSRQGFGSWVSCTAILVLGGIVGWVAGVLSGRLLNACQKLPEMPGQVLIGRDLIWFSGRLYQLRELGFSPLSARCCSGPQPYLEFIYQQVGSSGPITNRARVPMPKAAENSPQLGAILATFNV